jgi:hypothetical protein
MGRKQELPQNLLCTLNGLPEAGYPTRYVILSMMQEMLSRPLTPALAFIYRVDRLAIEARETLGPGMARDLFIEPTKKQEERDRQILLVLLTADVSVESAAEWLLANPGKAKWWGVTGKGKLENITDHLKKLRAKWGPWHPKRG